MSLFDSPAVDLLDYKSSSYEYDMYEEDGMYASVFYEKEADDDYSLYCMNE
jgi:hypothetical protein